ncbi:hypothetical protein [Leptothoe spongobia]|uniref:Uncharacterized protein n=1 Tax=Leptothoe spongobia TAU-MAC 1115 TaxID=1967444 RepID=A0A947DIN6_9CYAN|nr:hypothetical protein [Leptothoe spongobia]MBT9317663.1 hypothetical protein [Leptothoe spongobia TAU-MAC 1115]
MQALNSQLAEWSSQPGPVSWEMVPDFIQKALTAEGCTLLKHRREHPLFAHIRFQYIPLAYQGDLYYLQRWSYHEWGVSPSQTIFSDEGSSSLNVLSNGSLLSLLVKKAVASFYGDLPDNSPLQSSSSAKRYTNGTMLPLAG